MNSQLQQAFESLSKLPLSEQAILAEALIATVHNYELFADEEKQWDILLESEESQQWLEDMVLQVEKDIKNGNTLDFDPATYISER